jgi:hypothetical protein
MAAEERRSGILPLWPAMRQDAAATTFMKAAQVRRTLTYGQRCSANRVALQGKNRKTTTSKEEQFREKNRLTPAKTASRRSQNPRKAENRREKPEGTNRQPQKNPEKTALLPLAKKRRKRKKRINREKIPIEVGPACRAGLVRLRSQMNIAFLRLAFAVSPATTTKDATWAIS